MKKKIERYIKKKRREILVKVLKDNIVVIIGALALIIALIILRIFTKKAKKKAKAKVRKSIRNWIKKTFSKDYYYDCDEYEEDEE